MKKLIALTLSLLFLFGVASCDTKKNNNTPPQDDTGDTQSDSNIIHGHGAPNDNEGELYSLYVDDDTNKIYEKNAAYVPQISLTSLKRKQLDLNSDDAKWIYTNCVAGENFDKESSVGNALRSTFLSTNITLKCVMEIAATGQQKQNVITYVAYNYGNVLMKTEDNPANPSGFDGARLVGYSIYNVDNDQYQIFGNNNGEINDYTSYITSDDPGKRNIAANFTKRCLNNQLEETTNFSLFDTTLKELDNFTVANRIYSLSQTFSVSSALYDAMLTPMYGEGNYYVEFKDIEFKLNEEGTALEYFKFNFGYGNKDRTNTVEQSLYAEISDLRTTYFEFPE